MNADMSGKIHHEGHEVHEDNGWGKSRTSCRS
jgi:hypothetical protein